MRAKYQRFLVRWRSVRPGGTLVTTWGTSRRATLGLYAAATQFLHRWDTAAADESAWGAVPALLLVLPPSRSPNPLCGVPHNGLYVPDAVMWRTGSQVFALCSAMRCRAVGCST
jgi:hypothetical protein